MKITKKIGDVINRMMESKPVITTMAVLTAAAIIIISLGYFIVKTPTLMLTVAGVGVVWLLVLIYTKLLEGVKE